MTHYLQYLSSVAQAGPDQTLVEITAHFLEKEFHCENFAIISHRHHPNPFALAYQSEMSFPFEDWRDWIQAQTNLEPTLFGQKLNRYYYYIVPKDETAFYIFLSGRRLMPEGEEILQIWQLLNKIHHKSSRRQATYNRLEFANLGSNLIHDVNSLMHLAAMTSTSENFKKRLSYQEKVNEDLLFYLREEDVINEKLPVTDLLSASLQMLELTGEQFPLTIYPPVTDIEVDAELFSRAFTEIVKNAITAVEGDLKRIAISAGLKRASSPWQKHDWLELSIADQGRGIPDDYFALVRAPYFTTQKQSGHSGFGLALANKIIQAHNGVLDIQSVEGSGTQVTVYLPLQRI